MVLFGCTPRGHATTPFLEVFLEVSLKEVLLRRVLRSRLVRVSVGTEVLRRVHKRRGVGEEEEEEEEEEGRNTPFRRVRPHPPACTLALHCERKSLSGNWSPSMEPFTTYLRPGLEGLSRYKVQLWHLIDASLHVCAGSLRLTHGNSSASQSLCIPGRL